MKAFQGNAELKTECQSHLQGHESFEEMKTCGHPICAALAGSGGPKAAEDQLGIPVLASTVYRRLLRHIDAGKQLSYARDFVELMPVDARIHHLWAEFCIKLLDDEEKGLLALVDDTALSEELSDNARRGIHNVATLFREWCKLDNSWQWADFVAFEAAVAVQNLAFDRGVDVPAVAWACQAASSAATVGYTVNLTHRMAFAQTVVGQALEALRRWEGTETHVVAGRLANTFLGLCNTAPVGDDAWRVGIRG